MTSPAPGSTLGPYRVERQLGSGGMGVVYEAVDTQLERRVALKVISPHLADDPLFRERFVREARGQASLDSAHVVTVHAFGEQDGRLYIASQLIPDGDLGGLLTRGGAPPLDLAVDLMAQVASGLADAHAAGIAHRDIKPANVLLRRRDSGWHAYLADFGIARQVGDDQQLTATAVGTPSYMAPELHTGGSPTPAADVYSLGCLLWATITGTAPYAGTTDYQIVHAHLEDPIPQLEGPGYRIAEVNRVLRTALAKDPGQRYPTAAAMRDDLRRLTTLPDRPAPPPPPGPRSSAPHPSAPRRSGRTAALVVAAVVLVAGAAVGTAYAVTRDDEPERRSTTDDPTGTSGTPDLSDGPSPTARATLTAPTLSPPPSTATPNPPPTSTGGGGRSPEERRAIAAFTQQLFETDAASREDSRCIAAAVVDEVGFDEMVRIGAFTEDGEMGSPIALADEQIIDAITSTAFTCLM